MAEARDPREIPELDLNDLPMALDRGVGSATLPLMPLRILAPEAS